MVTEGFFRCLGSPGFKSMRINPLHSNPSSGILIATKTTDA